MELATRPGRRKFVNGLAKTIEGYAGLSPSQLEEWRKVKDQGKSMFNDEESQYRLLCLATSYSPTLLQNGVAASVTQQRPLDTVFVKYSVQDVVLLPKLYNLFDQKLNSKWRVKVEEEVFWRLQYARQATYLGGGRNMALGPW